jgi:hypothetical protein
MAALAIFWVTALCQGCFGCTPTGGFHEPIRAVFDAGGDLHVIAPYWKHTGYSPVFAHVTYARLGEGDPVVVHETEVLERDPGRESLVLDADGRPVALTRVGNTLLLVWPSASGTGTVGTDATGWSDEVIWVGDDGVLRITMNDGERAVTRALDGAFIEEPGDISELPEGYTFTDAFTSEQGKSPVWLLADSAAEVTTLVPATLECTTDGCAWNVGAAAAMTPGTPVSSWRLAGQTAGGTAVSIDVDATPDPAGGWINELIVTWPSGRYVELDASPGREFIAVAARPAEGFVVAYTDYYDDEPIVLLVFDESFDMTRRELEVDREPCGTLEMLTEVGTEGELVHVVTSNEESIVQYTLALATGERTVAEWKIE